MIGYLFPISGETSFARSGADVMILFCLAVREKLRACTCLLVAVKRRSPVDSILKATSTKMARRVLRERRLGVLAAA